MTAQTWSVSPAAYRPQNRARPPAARITSTKKEAPKLTTQEAHRNQWIGTAVDIFFVALGLALIAAITVASGGLAAGLIPVILTIGFTYGAIGGAVGAGVESRLDGDTPEETRRKALKGGLLEGVNGLVQNLGEEPAK